MKKIGLIGLVVFLVLNWSYAQQNELKLWYNKPGKLWTDALPVGNGRLGAMVYGKTEKEIIQFNEETLWSGQPHDYVHKGANHYFQKIREYTQKGNGAVYDIAKEHFMSNPIGQQCYQPMGDILFHFPGHKDATNYYRELDLETAITKVTYQHNGVNYSREIFSSNPGQAIFIHLKADKTKTLNFSVCLSSPQEQSRIKIEDGVVMLRGKSQNYHVNENTRKQYPRNSAYPESKLEFESVLKILSCDGHIVVHDNKLEVQNASKVLLALVAATSFVNYQDISADPFSRNSKVLDLLVKKDYASIKRDHINDYKDLFGRLNLYLGRSEISDRPTNERLQSFADDCDPSFVSLFFQYGRYLLISSSRQRTQPANLQGIWNDQMSPPWDSKYTININTEMNYWLAEKTNLSECALPLIEMVKELSQSGKEIAKEYYNLNGWVAHHNTDIWRGAAPIDGAGWGIWPTGGAWLAQHLWWHYQFSGDKHYLEEIYPVMKEASVFFSEYLTPDIDRPEWLISGPSNSPENGGLVMGPTMDHQIIRNLFANTIEAAGVLGVDHEFIVKLKAKQAKIAPNQIGKYGQLQEWMKDIDDPGNKHRHVSHLWGLFPGNEIDPEITPELAEACKVTLSHRGDEGTGWSRAWKINFWARLLDGDHAFLLLKKLMVPAYNNTFESEIGAGLYLNLFDAHPPFQIDGNFGATSGITEMFLQSHLKDKDGNYILSILPALPKELPAGKLKGICARGGFELEMEWDDGELISLNVLSKLGNPCVVKYENKQVKITIKAGQQVFLAQNLEKTKIQ